MQRCLKAGCFEAIAQDLRMLLRLADGRTPHPAAIIGSRTLQSTLTSGGRAGHDGAKRRKGSKAHAADTLGHLPALHVTPADTQDRDQVGQLAQAAQARFRPGRPLSPLGPGPRLRAPTRNLRRIALSGLRPSHIAPPRQCQQHRSGHAPGEIYQDIQPQSGLLGAAPGSGGNFTGRDRMWRYFIDEAEAMDDQEVMDIDIVGFSRGAAQAREFANRLVSALVMIDGVRFIKHTAIDSATGQKHVAQGSAQIG